MNACMYVCRTLVLHVFASLLHVDKVYASVFRRRAHVNFFGEKAKTLIRVFVAFDIKL